MARRYVMYGAGGIGGVIGARLFQHGHDVALICRGDHLAKIRKDGMTLKTPVDTQQLPIPAVGHPSELEFTPEDVVFLTMKTQDTVGALDDLRLAGGESLPLVCAQNGVENERLALRRFDAVYGMVVMFPASFVEPGVILNYEAEGHGLLEMGRVPEGIDPLIEAVAGDLAGSGFRIMLEDRVMRWKYNKVLRNLGAAFAAVIGPGAETDELRAKVKAEALAAFDAAGLDYASEQEEEASGRVPPFGWGDIEGHPPFASSVWQGIMRGNRSVETDYVNGEIAYLGARYGVPTPYNRALQAAATRCVGLGLEPGTVTVEDIERAVEAQQAAHVRGRA